MRPKRNKHVDDLAIALMLMANCTRGEIAARLQLDKSEVTRSLGRTDEIYWVRAGFVPGVGLSAVSDELLSEARRRIDENVIRPVRPEALMSFARATHAHLRSVEVVPASWGSPASEISEKFAAWMRDFARLAVPLLKPYLKEGRIWGVTWGSHVSATVNALAFEPEGGASGRRAAKVLPLCGNRYGTLRASETSSAVAEQLGLLLARQVAHPGAMTLVPAFILGDLSAAETVTVWKLIARSEGYLRIFGTGRLPDGVAVAAQPAPPLADALDGVITSVSRSGNPFGFGENGQLYENAGYDKDDIARRYLGDIGGVGLLRGDERPDRKLETRWTGITREQLFGCAARANAPRSRSVGVVVLASGRERVDCVFESVRQGFVSHLIIDESLNGELFARAGKAV